MKDLKQTEIDDIIGSLMKISTLPDKIDKLRNTLWWIALWLFVIMLSTL